MKRRISIFTLLLAILNTGCTANMEAAVGCAIFMGGCTKEEKARYIESINETNRKMNDRYGNSGSRVEQKRFIYTLFLEGGSSVCRSHDGSFDPQTLKGGYVGNKRIVRVTDEFGSC